jgi:hypothetical protein
VWLLWCGLDGLLVFSGVPGCASHNYGIVFGRHLKGYQCRSCRHQANRHCWHDPAGQLAHRLLRWRSLLEEKQ